MKKINIIILTLIIGSLLVACGKSEAASAVDQMIASIGEVSLESEGDITEAERAYDQLPDKDKAKVENLAELIDARKQYDSLRAERKKEVLESLYQVLDEVVLDDMDFVSKYAGNVNGKGSRKFADSFIERMQTCFNDVDFEAFKDETDIYDRVIKIRDDLSTITGLIIDMGNTNSDENVSTIKTMASMVYSDITTLLNNQLKSYKAN